MPRRERREAVGAGSLSVARAALAIALLGGPLAFGAVQPWAWAMFGILALLAYALVLQQRGLEATTLPRLALISAVGLVSLGLIQVVPLPAALASRLVPDRLAARSAIAPRVALAEPFGPAIAPFLPARPSTATLSFAPSNTREELLRRVVLLVILLASAALFRSERERRVLAATIAVAGGAAALLGLLQVHGETTALWFRVPIPTGAHPFGPYVNRNHFAGLMEAALPLAIVLAVGAWSERHREPGRALAGLLLGAAAALLMATGLALSGSRGGALGTAAGLATLALLVGRSTSAPGLRRSALALATLALLALALADGRAMLTRLIAIDSTDGSLSTRLQVWRSTVDLIAAHPLAGAGFGAFEYVFPAFEKPPLPWLFEHPESDWLWLVAEGGLPAALLAAGLVASTLAALRRSPDPVPAPAARAGLCRAGAGAGLVALALHGLVDVNLHIPANAAIAAALAGVVLRREPTSPPAPGSPIRRGALPTAVVLVLIALLLARAAAADLFAANAREALRRGQPPAVVAALTQRAVELDPSHARLREAAARAALDPVSASRHWAAALAGSPSNAASVFELGWLLALAPGDKADALEIRADYGEQLLRRAAELDPSFPGFRARYGLFVTLVRPPRLAEGLAELRSALTQEPERQDEILGVLEKRLPEPLLPRAVPDTPENRWRWAIRLDLAGKQAQALAQYRRALALAAAQPERTRHYRALIADRHLAVGRFALAEPLFQAQVAAGAQDRNTLGGLGTSLAALGRFPEAHAALARALALGPDPALEQALAWVAWNEGDCAVASAAAGRALTVNPQNVQALLVTGLCQGRAGDLGLAFTTLSRVRKLAPADPVAEEALRAIERTMAEALAESPAAAAP